jgi:hypothetical protein
MGVLSSGRIHGDTAWMCERPEDATGKVNDCGHLAW